jgi:hypothetical protein
MVLLSSTELAQIKSDIQEIVQDTSINTTIKYRQLSKVTTVYSVEQQKIEYGGQTIYRDWSGVSAIMGRFTENEIEKGIEVGDTKFVIMRSSVSGQLTTSDIVVESGTSYNVKKVMSDPLDIVYIIAGETI